MTWTGLLKLNVTVLERLREWSFNTKGRINMTSIIVVEDESIVRMDIVELLEEANLV